MTAKRGNAVLVGVLAAGVVAAAVVIGWRGGQHPDSLQARVRAVAATLRCPVCRDLSLADSPSPLSQSMRAEIARKLRAGQTPDEIRSDFVRSYGDWILLAPPSRGLGVLAWVAPVIALLGGIVAAGVIVRRWRAPPLPDPLSEPDRAMLARARASTPVAEDR